MENQLNADYKIGGGWGDSIQWSNPEAFEKDNDETTLFRVHGWQVHKPEIGQTLTGEFNNSFIKFEFVEVEYCGDPRDMFFAKVKPIEQVMKSFSNGASYVKT